MHELSSCSRYHRCKRYRTCDDCARLRQAHIADTAEQLLSKYNDIYMARFTPYSNTQAEIIRLKEAIKRRLDRSDAVWSIEQGTEKGLLHINLLSPVEFFKQFKLAEYWQSRRIENIRQAAAYMIKREQIPAIVAYSGRQFGTFKSMAELYADKKQTPIIQAAAAETITLAGWPLPEPYVARQKEIARMRAEAKSHKSTADDHLQKLRLYVDSLKGTVK
jgi:hypothetical protein